MGRKGGGATAGVTLLEVAASLAIFALAMLTLMGTLRVMAQGVTAMRARMERARLLAGMERVARRDFQGAVVLREKDLPACVGREGPGEMPVLEFFSTNSFAPAGQRPAGGLARVEYFLRPTEGAPGELALLRRERAYPEADAAATPEPERLAAGISECRLSFHDGRQWVTTWRQNSLPRAVRLEVAFKATSSERETLLFAPLATPWGVTEEGEKQGGLTATPFAREGPVGRAGPRPAGYLGEK